MRLSAFPQIHNSANSRTNTSHQIGNGRNRSASRSCVVNLSPIGTVTLLMQSSPPSGVGRHLVTDHQQLRNSGSEFWRGSNLREFGCYIDRLLQSRYDQDSAIPRAASLPSLLRDLRF